MLSAAAHHAGPRVRPDGRAGPRDDRRRCPGRRAASRTRRPSLRLVESREAQNASATYGGACRTSSEPCSTSAISSTSRRARLVEASSSACRAGPAAASSRASAPRADLRLGENASTAAGSRPQRPQHVERVDVAGALPDRVQRRLAVEPRQPALLDVAVAAQALQRLADDARARACRPSTCRPRPPAGAGRARPLSNACASRIASSGRRLGLDRQVGEHVAHQRLVGERPAERASGGERGASPGPRPGASARSSPARSRAGSP